MKRGAILPAPERLAGVEWMRGVAAFGVIAIHAGLVAHNRTTPAAAAVPDFFGFAVPFFLVTAFFFAIRGEGAKAISWGEWIRRRAGRLGVPFVFWSVVYLGLRLVKLEFHHQQDQVGPLLQDPAALVLSGGDSIALYFLPLVFMGFVLIRVLGRFLTQGPSWGLILGFLAGLVCHESFHRYNDVVSGLFPGLAESPLRLAVGLVRDAARCAPLVFVAALLARYFPPPQKRHAMAMLAAGGIYLVVPHLLAPPGYLLDSVVGVGAFLVAWGLSGLVTINEAASVVGLFSFGVYLVHQVFLEMIQVVFPMGRTVGVGGILAITASVYVASMMTVAAANRGGPVLRRIFGLR